MEAEQHKPILTSHSGSRRWILVVSAACVLVVALIGLVASSRSPRAPNLVWLPGRPIPPAKQLTAWSKVRLQIIRTTYPFWRHFRRSSPTLRIDVTAVSVPKIDAEQFSLELGQPTSTDSSSAMRAWIVTAEQLQKVNAALKAMPDANLLAKPRLTLGSGSQAQLMTGAPGAGNLTVNVSPKVLGNSIRLAVGGEWVQRSNLGKTNGIHCRVVLSNGGALVVEEAAGHDPVSERSVIVITATAVDARGNPTRL